jgi:ribosomal protein L28
MASSNVCKLCDKGSKMAGGYSNRIRATKFNPSGDRRKYPNLQWVALPKTVSGLSGGRIKICTRCIKGSKHLELKAK